MNVTISAPKLHQRKKQYSTLRQSST